MITNLTDIPLVLAPWLLHDDYDYDVNKPNYISATTLLKPLRQIVLAPRVEKSTVPMDLEDFIARATGTAWHTAIEAAWKTNPQAALKMLGIPQHVIDSIKVNPTDDEVRGSNSIIPIYLEQRAFREHAGFTVGGKFDMVAEGIVHDTKSTSAYAFMGDRGDAYQLQMSIYRWIDAAQPLRKIHEDYGTICFIFTDWQRSQAKSNPNYPKGKIAKKDIPLLSLADTERWVENKLALVKRHFNTPEKQLPECTDEELWRSAPKYKYYADPAKTAGKSTRNFDSLSEANAHLTEKGKGVVLTIPGEPKRCNYCPVFNACSQKDRYFQS